MMLLHPALVVVALATAGPRAYEGPVVVAERPRAAPTAPGWPASAGPPPGSGAEDVVGDMSLGAGEPGDGDMSLGAGDASGSTLPGAAAPGIEREVRYIEVTSNMLGRSSRIDIQRHAGGRAIVETKKAIEQGASSVAEMLD